MSPTQRSRTAAAQAEKMKEETKPKPSPPPIIDTSAMQLEAEDDEEIPLSNMFTVCLLFIVHTSINGLMLSAWNPTRCLFWKLGACPPDLDWITTWLSVGHFQVAMLLAFLAKAVYNRPSEEAKLSYLIMAILGIEMAAGMVSKPFMHRPFLMVQLTVWTLLLSCLGWFTYSEYDMPLPSSFRYGGAVTPVTPTPPRELFVAMSRTQGLGSTRSLGSVGSVASGRSGFSTPSSLHSRKRGFSVVSIAVAVMTLGALIQAFELVLLQGKTSYYVGSSSNTSMATGPFQNSADMVIIDKWIVTVILAATLRFFDVYAQRSVLMGKIGCLMLQLIVLTSDNGELMENDARRAAGVGAFFMILTAVVGIL